MDRIKDANLYIWLGMDNLFCLDLKQILLSEVQPKLEKVFSLRDIEGSDEYPSRMGLFVMDSKLHFLGGENLNREGYSDRHDDDYFNKKVFSFNLPSFTPGLSTRIPCHSGNKVNPIVFTISNKVYALSTIPSPNLENVFEVYEPEVGEVGEWRSLPPPPVPANCSVISHCVFQNNLFITTSMGDYIFYANANAENGKWEPYDKFKFRDSKICDLLEYKDHILVLYKDPLKLVAYESASFDSSPEGVELDMCQFFCGFGELNISWASLNIIVNNYICLVFFSTHKIHLFLFRFIPNEVTYGTCTFVEAYQEFVIPGECNSDYFPFYSTFLLCTKDDEKNEESPTAVSQLDTNRDRYLYISLGCDNLFSLNFNELRSGEDKLDLKLLHTNYNSKSEFPIGTGLFFWDSKLHFFGGEDSEKVKYQFRDGRFKHVQKLMCLGNNLKPKYRFNQERHASKNSNKKWGEEWGNKKVFSFNLPDFTRVNNSTLIPHHSSCKFRPFVFTISNKVYALSKGPISLINFSLDKVNLFEVYDLVDKKWRVKDLHPELKKLICTGALCIKSHCVFRNKLLLQTNRGVHYLFEVSGNSGKWRRADDNKFPSFWAGVEYNDKFLLVLTKRPNELVAYDMASFGEDNSNSTPPTKLYIYNNENCVLGVSRINEAPSLQLVDHNLINLVFVSSFDKKIHVMLLKVELPLRHAVVQVYRAIDIPEDFHEFYLGINSTFLWQSDVIQHDDTINKRKEENST